MTYTIYVLDDRGDDTVLATRSVRGNKACNGPDSAMSQSRSDDPEVCVYATSSAGAEHVFDRRAG